MLKDAKTIVFKVGTSTLTHDTGKTNIRGLEQLCLVLSDLMNEDKRIVLVDGEVAGAINRIPGEGETWFTVSWPQNSSSMGD